MSKLSLARSAVFCAIGFATPAAAENFTTASEVRPILEATQKNWVSLREYDGQDLLYFTHLLAWRCGLSSIHYALNDGAETTFDAEPCYESKAQPNAITATDKLPFITLPLSSVNKVMVRISYDDGADATAQFSRSDILGR